MCDAACSTTYSVSVPQSGQGAACEAFAGTTDACDPGEGECPTGHCVGAWSPCTGDCDKTFTVSTPQDESIVGSQACEAEHGDSSTDCAPGEDACPHIDCVGTWSECTVNCTRVFTVDTEPSPGGLTCDEAKGGLTETCGSCAPTPAPEPEPDPEGDQQDLMCDLHRLSPSCTIRLPSLRCPRDPFWAQRNVGRCSGKARVRLHKSTFRLRRRY